MSSYRSFGHLRCVLSCKDRRVCVRSPATSHVHPWVLLEVQQSYELYSASRAWSGLAIDTLVRDGATTVEAVSMTFMLNDG